jgi:hypothetical protein
VPKRANPGSWRNAAKSPGIENFSLYPGHFPPLGDSPHPKPESTRNEGVPGSSPGVGSLETAGNRGFLSAGRSPRWAVSSLNSCGPTGGMLGS